MPMIRVPIPETIESVSRPVTLDILRQLMQWAGISSKTNIAFFGDLERSKQLNSALGSIGDDPNKFAHNDKIAIDVIENYMADRIPNEPMYNPENLLVFRDQELNIVMKPIYSMMDVTISVKYRAASKAQATKWRDGMKARISQHVDLYLHEAMYSFGIPDELLYVLKELHRLRENVDGYGDTFDQYFADRRTPEMTYITNQSGTAGLWTVPELQTRIQAWYDWEIPDESAHEGAGSAVTTSFNYKFFYSRPTLMAMIYPLVVHNQLIDQKFRDTPLKDHNDERKKYAMSARVFDSFESAKVSQQQLSDYGYAIPTFDEFMPRSTPIKTRRLVTVLFTLDDTDPTLFLNLTQLGQIQFTPEIVEYMKAERDYMVVPGMSPLNLAFYRDDFLIEHSPAPITVDADLNVRTLMPINRRRQHHLRVGLLTDWDMLRGNALERMQDHGNAAIQMLLAIDPSLEARGFLPKLVGGYFVSKSSLQIAIDNILPANEPAGSRMHFNTVQFMFVQTDHLRAV